MLLAKVDIAALILPSVSAGVVGFLLLCDGVLGGGSALSRLVSILLFLVHVGTELRVVGREARRPHGGRRGEGQAAARFDDHVMIRGSEMDASRLEAVARRRLLHGQRGGALEHHRQEARLARMPMEDDRERRLKISG